MIELLSPAGSFETARVAIEQGADAVYVGLRTFSARAQATNFSLNELRDLLAYAHSNPQRPRKVYVACNTLVDEDQLPEAIRLLAQLEPLACDGLIVQDLGLARVAHHFFPSIPLHASTQLVAHNLEGVWALKELGFTRVVLARELSLEEIRMIASRGGCEIEVFVHGALCYSISGLCLFSALEKQRSGNRGACAYCCRLAYQDEKGLSSHPFSMCDLRLDEHLPRLREAGVASLKIEGRMKSALYVGSVTKHYREILDGHPSTVSQADLETVFSRHTTPLYLDTPPASSPHTSSVIDPNFLGHLGTVIGRVKRITKDREGHRWLRFHTSRALERHDGLQFLVGSGKPLGFGITDMRVALSRTRAFSVPAQSDVEILLPETIDELPAQTIITCSSSNEMKRRFPIPSFRPSDYPHARPLHVCVALSATGLTVSQEKSSVSISKTVSLEKAQHPERTEESVRKAFARLGETPWRLASLKLIDPESRFVPVSVLNEVRRAFIARLDEVSISHQEEQIRRACEGMCSKSPREKLVPEQVLKMRLDQDFPSHVKIFDELVFALDHSTGKDLELRLLARLAELRQILEPTQASIPTIRLALPIWTSSFAFQALRTSVKHLVRAGLLAWEVPDLATLHLVKVLGLGDVTADWTLYAMNHHAIESLAHLGVTRLVASPENTPENNRFLSEGNFPLAIEFLQEQSTPLFISRTPPETSSTHVKSPTGVHYQVSHQDNLWITSRSPSRTFSPPPCARTLRTDLSWNSFPAET